MLPARLGPFVPIAAALVVLLVIGFAVSATSGGMQTLTVGTLARAAVPVPKPTILPAIDVGSVHATAEAALGRPDAQRQAPQPTAPPKPAAATPAAKPGSPAPAAPAPAIATVALQAPPTRAAPVAPTTTPPPTRTFTPTATATLTTTPTATSTATPVPKPCSAPYIVPTLFTGNGFFTQITNEVAGDMAVVWPVANGHIRVYDGKPVELGQPRAGVSSAVPSAEPIQQGFSGRGGLNLNVRPAGAYTIYFFNGSPFSIGESEATLTYWTYGHCP